MAPSAGDNCPNIKPPVCNPPSGSVFPIGSTPFTCDVADSSGNVNVCSSVVEVNDRVAPVISRVSAEPERSGTGNGRVYTLTIQCADASGNTSVRTISVSVTQTPSPSGRVIP